MSGPIKVVVALGGNALEDKSLPPTAASQLEVAGRTARQLAQLSCAGYELAIVHGNGPQVGRILLASETAADVTPPMPFDVCGAMSQGYIGYHIQQALKYALAARNRNYPVVSLTTQVVVDKNDPAFQNPTKPIGGFYSAEEARQLEQEKGYVLREDAGRGWRRVVASPKPLRIIERDSVRSLLDQGHIVVSGGGGGIPVAIEGDHYVGVEAVVDKDLVAAIIARDLNADKLVILTGVDQVFVDFGKPTQKPIFRMSAEQARAYMEEGQFPEGSMKPKIQAALGYLAGGGKEVVITSIEKLAEALEGKSGTAIYQDS